MEELTKAGHEPPPLDPTLTAYATVLQHLARNSAFEAMREVPALLDPGEQLWTVIQAQRRDREKGIVVLALTDRRLVVVEEVTRRMVEDHKLADLRLREWAVDRWWGTRLSLETPNGPRTYKQVLPGRQGDRIAFALGHPRPPGSLDLLTDQTADPQHLPVSCFWELELYRDRLIDHTSRQLPFTGEVNATVDTAGNIEVTRGRNLASKAVFGTLWAPATSGLSYFMAGNAKHREIDKRELFLLVEGPSWAYTQQFVPDVAQGLREFAQTINFTARQAHERTVAPPRGSGSKSSPIEMLTKLAELRDQGILTQEEFAAKKADILKSF